MVVRRDLKVFAGDRLRRLREGRHLSQGMLARSLGVSPSYLSQMEADLRPIPVALRGRVTTLFGVASSYFADEDDERLAVNLREATGDALFRQPTVSADEVRAAVRAAPDVARRFLTLYRAYLALDEQLQGLQHHSGRTDGPGAPHFAHEDVRDWVQAHHNYFDELDRAAEALSARRGFAAATLRADLAGFLEETHGITVQDAPTLLAQGTVWRLQRDANLLLLAEEATPSSKAFWTAHVLGLLTVPDAIGRAVGASGLTTPESRALARISLANYFAGALIMPYELFLAEAERLRYDVQRLQARFGASFEQVCHRLSTLQRPRSCGIPFFLVKTDIAGNVLKRSSAARFRFARFGGSCPLWNVYSAFAQPGRLLVQVARMPDGVAYLNVARTVGREESAYMSRPRKVAVVIGCEVGHAARTVYAAGLDLSDPGAEDPIGPGCRACERTTCRHRAMPPASHAVDVGTSERGVVPYRILE